MEVASLEPVTIMEGEGVLLEILYSRIYVCALIRRFLRMHKKRILNAFISYQETCSYGTAIQLNPITIMAQLTYFRIYRMYRVERILLYMGSRASPHSSVIKYIWSGDLRRSNCMQLEVLRIAQGPEEMPQPIEWSSRGA